MKINKQITIFTPTYNRSNRLIALYNSLCFQTYKDFEWIIVDDGSVDNTNEVVESFLSENKIDIVYFKKTNGGKHTAINKGVELANGMLFFIVDSDDYLTHDAIEIVVSKYNSVKHLKDVVGVCGRRGYSKEKYIGSQFKYDDILSSSLDFRYVYKIKGDMAEVVITSELKKYPFPTFLGEKYCPEDLIWNRISNNKKILWFSEIIYIGEYLEGGITDRILELRKNSSNLFLIYYSELGKYNISFIQKYKSIINFWRFSIYNKKTFQEKWGMIDNKWLSILSFPISLFMIVKDNIKK